MLNPAKSVIDICGGITQTSVMAERSENRVRRWGMTKEKGGTGGLIPADRQVQLMRAAIERGIDLRPEHFFPECVLQNISPSVLPEGGRLVQEHNTADSENKEGAA